jgi:outer membrane lipoprotein-sorting protein
MKGKCILCSVLFFFVLPVISIAQDKADEVINQAVEKYQKQLEKVNDMTTTYEDGVHYLKREKHEGKIVTKARVEQEVNGQQSVSIYDGEYYWTKNSQTGDIQKSEMETYPVDMVLGMKDQDYNYQGTEKVHDSECHHLTIEDAPFSEMPFPGMAESMSQAETEDMTFDADVFIDTEKLVTRKLNIEIDDVSMEGDNKERDVKITMLNSDFKNVSGVDVAYYSESVTEFEMSPEEKQQMKESREQMKKEMENMPEEQREMIKSRMEAMDKTGMMSGEMKSTRKVKEVKINTGIDDSLFNTDNL